MRLLLDQDGPLAGFDEKCFDIFKHEMKLELEIERLEHSTFRYFTDHITNPEHKRSARDILEAQGWFRELPVVPGSQEGVDALLSAGVDIWICTKPMKENLTCRDEKFAWIQEHFPMLANKIVMTPDKSLVKGDILLDDAFDPAWCELADWNGVVYSAPYNGQGSQWADFPRWGWNEPIERLLNHATI